MGDEEIVTDAERAREIVREEINTWRENLGSSDAGGEQRANEAHVELVANSEHSPLDREDLQGMPAATVERLADAAAAAEDEDGEVRVNYAGMPRGKSFDSTEAWDDGDVVPAGGYDTYRKNRSADPLRDDG